MWQGPDLRTKGDTVPVRVAINGFGRTALHVQSGPPARCRYDNEWGYADRLGELAERVLEPVGSAA
jgi:hypothetical protein